jgi:hypothetical protein
MFGKVSFPSLQFSGRQNQTRQVQFCAWTCLNSVTSFRLLAFYCWQWTSSYFLQFLLTSDKFKVSFGKALVFTKSIFWATKLNLAFLVETKIGHWFTSAYNSTFAIGVQFVSVWRDFSGWLIRFPKLHLSQNARPSQMCKTLAGI